MTRLLIFLAALLFAGNVLAQDTESDSQDEPAAEESSAAEEVTDEEIEALLGLDEEDYSEIEEDDFEASVEVRFEQSVPFPTDI